VRNEEVLQRVKEERNILHSIRRRSAKWIGHILCRDCLLTHNIEGKVEGRIEVTGRRGRRPTHIPDDLKEKRLLEIEIGSTRSHSGEQAEEDAMDLSCDRRLNECMNV
jgi:hypothetical protein